MCWHSNCLCNINLRICMCADKLPWGRAASLPALLTWATFISSHIHICTQGNRRPSVAERDRAANTLSCCVCWILHLHHTQPLTPGLTGDLCVGEVWPVRYLRGDTGTPAHALLTAPSWGCPPHCLGAVLYTSTAAGDCWWMAPWWWTPTSLHALPPAMLHRCPSRTGVIVVMAALVTRPCAQIATAPVWPLSARRWVLLMVTPASWSPGKAVAEGLWGDVW